MLLRDRTHRSARHVVLGRFDRPGNRLSALEYAAQRMVVDGLLTDAQSIGAVEQFKVNM